MAAAVPDDDDPVACLLSEREFAIRADVVARGLLARYDEIAELADGYAFRFAPDEELLAELLAFIAAERRCCPFLTFELAFAPYRGPLWLRLRGSPRVKDFIADAFVHHQASGRPGSD